MSRRELGGYGSPFNPEVIGTAQLGLSEIEDIIEVHPITKHLQNEAVNEESLLKGYKAAAAENYSILQSLQQITKVYDTGMVPHGDGHELIFETIDGSFFNSVGETLDQAMHEGVTYHLSLRK